MSTPETILGSEDPSAVPIEDKELVLAFKRGEDGSYQAIYERYSPRVQGICRRLLVQSHDAEEAQQETFMRVFTGLPNFNGRYQLGAWVGKIATNVCLDHIRSKGRRPADSTDQADLVDLSDSTVDSPEDSFMKGDERQRVREVLAGLAPTHRAALALREFEGMTYSDIAVALGMSEPQVKALIHRARKSFKKQWGSSLAFLLPWRLIARIRRFSSHYDAPPQIADAAASTTNIASSCSAALHQCGAFVTDKAAGAFTALIVGTAAVGAAVAPGREAARPDLKRESAAVSIAEPPVPKKHVTDKKEPRRKKPVVVAAPAPDKSDRSEPDASPAEPTEPAPSEPEEDPSEDQAGKPADKPTESAPAPLTTSFGWDRGQPIPRATPTSNVAKVDCAAGSVSQRVESLMNDGAFSYRAVFQIEVSRTHSWMQLALWKDGREYRYSSWGAAPAVKWSTTASETRLEITGEYGAIYGFDPESANLPASGHFDATLTLDCGARSVVTEGGVFTAE